ncbi:MAG: GLPGLI family protein [Bacteroidetes bacterium]|nr:GLPGLI family protein [Bacteroidota bacterium]
MKKVNFILILLVMISNCFGQQNSQNISVQYHFSLITKSGTNAPETFFLVQDKDEKYCLTVKQTVFNDGLIMPQNLNRYGFLMNYHNKNIISEIKLKIPKQKLITLDTIPEMKWKIVNSFQEILGYRCQKANTIFRGREYEVYFTKDIPITEGPWKFSGLPGLILKAKTKDDIFSFEAVKIKYSQQSIISNEIKKVFQDNYDKSISYKKYIALENKHNDSLIEKIMANTSNTEPNAKDYDARYYNLEKSFEWEAEKKP